MTDEGEALTSVDPVACIETCGEASSGDVETVKRALRIVLLAVDSVETTKRASSSLSRSDCVSTSIAYAGTRCLYCRSGCS
jgi:hypothetical protein